VHRAGAVLAVLLAAGLAQAGPAVVLASPSTLALTLTALPSIPLQLAAGPDDNTTELSVALSGALVGSKLANSRPGLYDALYVNNTSSTDYQFRLVLVSVTNQTECVKCKLWVSNLSSGAQQLQINITAGVAALASGPWQNVNRATVAGHEYHVWAEHNVSTGKEARLGYALEYAPRGATSPSVSYVNMTFVARGTVDLSNQVFTPANFSISAGESVTWHWVQGKHGVEDLNGTSWCSTRTAPAADCSRSFASPGTYGYRCTIHAVNMVGTVRVF
jgi:plastocyanin